MSNEPRTTSKRVDELKLNDLLYFGFDVGSLAVVSITPHADGAGTYNLRCSSIDSRTTVTAVRNASDRFNLIVPEQTE